MNAFDIIAQGFARPILGNAITGDPVRDSANSLTMSHLLKNENGTSCRLTGWAIFRASGSTLQANLAASGIEPADPRTRYEAFAAELANFREPVVLMQFGKRTVNLANVFATIDPRITKVCSPDRPPEIFDFSANTLPENAGVAERKIRKALIKLGAQHAT